MQKCPFFVLLINEIEGKIKADHRQIDAVEHQHVIELSAGDLSKDPGKIPYDDGKHKNKTFALCGAGSQAFID